MDCLFVRRIHAAFDAGLFDIEPQTLRLLIKSGLRASALGISAEVLSAMQNAPHQDALCWRWQSRSDGRDASATNPPASMAPASAPSEVPVASPEAA